MVVCDTDGPFAHRGGTRCPPTITVGPSALSRVANSLCGTSGCGEFVVHVFQEGDCPGSDLEKEKGNCI